MNIYIHCNRAAEQLQYLEAIVVIVEDAVAAAAAAIYVQAKTIHEN